MIALLADRRFRPLFWTQLLGAFNDNLFKNALVVLVTWRAYSAGGLDPQQLVALCGGLFILPFLLFSALAGQLADKLPKATLIRRVKLAEIPIMTLAAVGFVSESLPVLLATLFLMGLQSAFFGPLKYGVLPELLHSRDLVGGNALVETGTFVAILAGTITGGVLIALGEPGVVALSVGVVLVAMLGRWTAGSVPATPAAAPNLRVGLDPVRPALETLRVARRVKSVWLSLLGISWFWFVGASLLSVLPAFTREVLGGSEAVVTLFLGLFCAGVAAGSLLAERLSGGRLELGLVPVGSIFMSLAALDLFLVGRGFAPLASDGSAGVGMLLAAPGGLRLCFDFLLLAIAGGLYTVPLYTLMQQRSDTAVRARVVAANNILNALFMVAAAALLMVLPALSVSLPATFLLLAMLNAVVAACIYRVIPEFLLRFVIWATAHALYRLRVIGAEHIPAEGPAVIVANHVSFVDWLLIAAASKRPPRFVMDHRFRTLPLVGFVFRDAGVIPIAPAKEDPAVLQRAFDAIAEALEADEVVCIFPEGAVTRDGRQHLFRPGIERILARTPVPVVPVAIGGMWGSFFSRRHGRAMSRPFRRFRARVELAVGAAVPAAEASAARLAHEVAVLGGWTPSSVQK